MVFTCPIILNNGKRCGKEPHPNSVHDLCPEHWIAIIEDRKRSDAAPQALAETGCPVCRTKLLAGPGTPVACPNPTCWEDRWWEQPAKDADKPIRRGTHWVYYIRFGDRIKIGTSQNLKGRLATLPYDELLAFEPGDVKLERMRQAHFEAYRIDGQREWFHANDRILTFAASVRDRHGSPTALLTAESA